MRIFSVKFNYSERTNLELTKEKAGDTCVRRLKLLSFRVSRAGDHHDGHSGGLDRPDHGHGPEPNRDHPRGDLANRAIPARDSQSPQSPRDSRDRTRYPRGHSPTSDLKRRPP